MMALELRFIVTSVHRKAGVVPVPLCEAVDRSHRWPPRRGELSVEPARGHESCVDCEIVSDDLMTVFQARAHAVLLEDTVAERVTLRPVAALEDNPNRAWSLRPEDDARFEITFREPEWFGYLVPGDEYVTTMRPHRPKKARR